MKKKAKRIVGASQVKPGVYVGNKSFSVFSRNKPEPPDFVDFVDEMVVERTKKNPRFSQLVAAAGRFRAAGQATKSRYKPVVTVLVALLMFSGAGFAGSDIRDRLVDSRAAKMAEKLTHDLDAITPVANVAVDKCVRFRKPDFDGWLCNVIFSTKAGDGDVQSLSKIMSFKDSLITDGVKWAPTGDATPGEDSGPSTDHI
jgi:hypothetical protein